MKRSLWYFVLLVFSLIVVLSGCLSNNPWPSDLQARFEVDIKGLKDTLRLGRDTLIISAEMDQPVSYWNMARGFNGKEENAKIPDEGKISFYFGSTRVYTKSNLELGLDYGADSTFIRIANMGRFKHGLTCLFDIGTERIYFSGKFIPTKPGLYVTSISDGYIRAPGIDMVTRPSFNLPDKAKNHHLLNESMKQWAGLHNDYGRGTVIAFYVK